MASYGLRVPLGGAVSSRAKHRRPAPSVSRSRFVGAASNNATPTRSIATVASAGAPASPPESAGVRKSGNFPPSEWDYGQILSSTDDVPVMAINDEKYNRLKKEIKKLLTVTVMPLEKLELVDSLQQLGISYHFEEEIRNVLESLFIEADIVFSNEDDIHATALLFKVLRENGYKVSQDVFKKFLCGKDGFICFYKDNAYVKGILSLYEATFQGFEGEEILDMARKFASTYLRTHMMTKKMDVKLRQQVRHVLQIPTYWRLRRAHAWWYLNFNDGTSIVDPIVVHFAELDYNIVQELHKREIGELTKWWHNLSLKEELKFSRDLTIESYIWTMRLLFHPKHGNARKYLTQAISLLTIIDDVYNVYGSANELEEFTNAIERWDANAIENLPKYMRICFLTLFNIVNESTYHILKEKDIVIAPYIKNLWDNLCKAYLVEAKWFHGKHMPPLEEYIRNGTMPSCVQLVLSYAYIFGDCNVSIEVLKFLQMSPNLIGWSGKILRLNNDMGTSSKEVKGGDVVKAIECYQQERNVSKQEAQLHIQNIIMDTWKSINENKFSTPIQKDIVDICLDICRSSHCFYQNGDGYGSPTKDQVTPLSFDAL